MSGSEPSSLQQSPTASQSLLTTDDRAQLLPPTEKEVPPPSPSADIQAQVKSSIVDVSREVYTITDESLPTHMRSLLPSHEQHVHDLLTLERTRRRLRYVIIGLTVLLALTVLVAVALVFSLKVKPGSGALEMGRRYRVSPVSSTDTQVAEVATELQFSLLSREGGPSWPSYKHKNAEDRRSPCIKECWTYAAFRFRSVCEDGYCRCHGENYDTYSCLPKYHGCHMQRRSPKTAPAKLFGKNQTTFSCLNLSQDAGKPRVHVISIFGNHRSPTTHVKVQSSQPGSSSTTTLAAVKGNHPQSPTRTLVLVNYHYVMWTVHLPLNSGISKVIVVSMKRSSQANEVRFIGVPDDLQKPEVIHKLSLTGYGQDKNVGHTPKLLKFIEEDIGPVTSFLGASHADELTLDLIEGSEDQSAMPKTPVIIGETTTSL